MNDNGMFLTPLITFVIVSVFIGLLNRLFNEFLGNLNCNYFILTYSRIYNGMKFINHILKLILIAFIVKLLHFSFSYNTFLLPFLQKLMS